LAPKAARGARGRAGAGHKVRPGGPTNWPARRASGRPGRPVGRTAKERGLFRQRKRPGYWPRRAVSLSWGGGPPPATMGTHGRAEVVVVRKPACPKRSAGLAGFPFYGELHFVKSGPAPGCAALTAQAGKAAQLDAKGRFLRPKRRGARRKTWGVHVPPRRENAVLAHPRANLKGHFARNGYKRAFKAFRGKGSFRPGKRRQALPAAVIWARRTGELSGVWLSKGLWPG